MPPKKKAGGGGGSSASKKAAEKAKIVEDKTFGLKNKNKSKKVQSYVKQVEQQAQNKVEGRRRGGAGASTEPKATSKKAQLAARLEELSLLNQPVVERPKKVDAEAEARRKAREAEEAERLRIASLPVEEQIEEERAKLTTRTPVTLERFLEWKKEKDVQRAAEEAAKLAVAQKGLSRAERARGGGLTGRQLFEQHQDIFVDDAEASDGKYVRDQNAWIGDAIADGDGDKRDRDHDADLENEEDDNEDGDALADDTEAAVGDESLFS